MWTITFIVLAVASSGVFAHSAVPMAEQSLANAILKSSRSMENNPQRSMECFTVYLPKINEATNNYELAYSQCLDTAANAIAAVEAEVAADRASVRYDGDGICTLFQECSQKDSSVDFFQCYYDSAGEAITKSYGIQTLAKDRMQYIDMKYQTITYTQQTCTDTASEEYVRETSALYAELDACLSGVVVTPAPVVTTTYQDTTSTESIPTPPQPE